MPHMITVGWYPIEHPRWVHTRWVLSHIEEEDVVDIYLDIIESMLQL